MLFVEDIMITAALIILALAIVLAILTGRVR